MVTGLPAVSVRESSALILVHTALHLLDERAARQIRKCESGEFELGETERLKKLRMVIAATKAALDRYDYRKAQDELRNYACATERKSTLIGRRWKEMKLIFRGKWRPELDFKPTNPEAVASSAYEIIDLIEEHVQTRFHE